MTKEWQRKTYHRCQSYNHVNVYSHIDKNEKSQARGKGFNEIVVGVFGRDIEQIEDEKDVESYDYHHAFKT